MADHNDIACFDEESCRYFLAEVGARVVPNYPFSYGMEEVYSLIVEEYGYNGVPDVTSVLQELLEEDGIATGIGDDGDVWRSWRHNWRHRNDDALDPHIPKVGNFILLNPSPRSLRCKRADNFLSKIKKDDQVVSTFSPEERGSGSDVFLTSATYSHQRCRLALPTNCKQLEASREEQQQAPRKSVVSSITTAMDSQQDFTEVTNSMFNVDFDPCWLVSFEMLQPGDSIERAESSVRGGQAPICTLLPVSHENPRAIDGKDCRQGRSDSTSSEHAWQSPSLAGCKELQTPPSRIEDKADAEQNAQPKVTNLEAEWRTPCRENPISLNTSPEHYYSNNQGVTPAETPEPQRNRIANRHARLIDGAIFPFNRRKSNVIRPSIDVEEAATPESSQRPLFRLSWTPTRRSSDSRRSWLQGFRSLFRSSQNNPSRTLFKQHRHSCSIGNSADAVLGMSKSHRRKTSTTPSVGQLCQSRQLGLMLDGACDDTTSPTTSYLNKPLPLNPDEIVRSMNSHVHSISTGPSRTPSSQPQSASTTSTRISQTSSKREFRALAKELLTNDPDMHYSHLSPVRETPLDPSKFDPLKSPAPLVSPQSFTGLAQRNPYIDDPVVLTPKQRVSVDLQNRFRNPATPSGLPPSQSEPNLRPISPLRPARAAYYSPPNLPQSLPPSSPERTKAGQENQRGRSASREAPKEGKGTELGSGIAGQAQQAKRSRSPVKRLLGLERSTPKKEPKTPVPDELNTPTAASSTKKHSLKQWSDKIRHGFLSADQEELRREAEIDHYLGEVTTKSETPTTFPISLDPAYQARLLSDVELLICVSANKFLLNEVQHGRISKDSVNKIRRSWESKNLAQVLEYCYDQGTQRELVLANFRTVQFHGPFSNDPVALNSAMLSWGTMAREMSIRTFCSADSAIKKQLHDAQRVLEMLGAPLVTCLAFEQLHVKALVLINKQQTERLTRNHPTNAAHTRNASSLSKTSRSQNGPFPRRDYSDKTTWIPQHKRNLSEGECGVIRGAEEESIEEKIRRMNVTPAAPPQLKVRKPTGPSSVGTGRGTSSHNSSPSRYRERFQANGSGGHPGSDVYGSPDRMGW